MDGVQNTNTPSPQAVAEIRDRREEIVALLARFPSTQRFFAELGTVIETDGDPITLLKAAGEAQADGHAVANKWLAITEDMTATFYNELARMEGEIARLNKNIMEHKVALKATKDALTTVSAAKPTGGGDTSSDDNGNIPIQHPTPFTGEQSDAAQRTREYQAWRQRVRGVWLNQEKQFHTERTKLLYLPSVLGGKALQGVADGLETVTKHPNNAEQWEWKTAEAVIAALDKTYDTYDLTADAWKRWYDLRQEGKFANYNDFIAEYLEITRTLKFDDVTKVMHFEAKVSKTLREALKLQVDKPGPTDFDGWVETTRKLVGVQGLGQGVAISCCWGK